MVGDLSRHRVISLFFFRFSSLLAPTSFPSFAPASLPSFAPTSFLGKLGQSELLPIFYPRHGNVFGGAKANVIFITRGVAHTNTSPQHFQANIFTMPSSYFTPTFSHRDTCLLFFHLLQHHWTPHFFAHWPSSLARNAVGYFCFVQAARFSLFFGLLLRSLAV